MSVALHHRTAPQPNMGRILLWSFIGHILILVGLSLSLSYHVKVSAPAIQVKLVGVPQPTASAPKQPPEKIRTQDSAAPKDPPKETKNIPPSDATTKFMTEQKPLDPEKKIDPIEAKERPPTLDKSPKEKKVVKNDLDAKVVKNPEDFMDSIDNLIKDAKPNTKPAPVKPVTDKAAGEGPQLQMNLSDQGVNDAIGALVNKNWITQRYDVKGLSVTVQVKLSPSGDLIGLNIVKSSGDPSFDNSLLRAIRKSVPLPIPTDKMGGYLDFEMAFSK